MLQPETEIEGSIDGWTRWRNDTKDVLSFTVFTDDNAPRKFVFQPGDTKAIDSRFDRAIHVVACSECSPESAKKTCGKPNRHPGELMGGLCPQLVRADGQKYHLARTRAPIAHAASTSRKRAED